MRGSIKDMRDARQALLQAVSDRLVEEAKKRETLVDKALAFAKRVRLLKVARLAAPMLAHAGIGSVAGGPLGAFIGAATGFVQGLSDEAKREEQLAALKDAYADLKPELKELIAERREVVDTREAHHSPPAMLVLVRFPRLLMGANRGTRLAR